MPKNPPSESLAAQATELQRNLHTGLPCKIRCTMALPAQVADETDTMRAFLGQHEEELDLKSDAKSLKLTQDINTPLRRVVRYQQCYEGIPLVDRSVVVQLDKTGLVKQLDLAHEPASKMRQRSLQAQGDEAQKLPAEAAITIALDHLENPQLRTEVAAPQLVYLPTNELIHLAYLISISTRAPAHDWRVIIDAFSGEILQQRDHLLRVNGTGLVFDPNPVVTANDNSFRDPAAGGGCGFVGTPLATIDAQRVSRTLRDIKLANGTHHLEGPFVKIVSFGNPAPPPPTEANANGFNYSSADSRFDAVNVYYHIDTVQRYIQGLGITTAHNSQIPADPHDNSNGGGAYFSPVDGGLHFGDSGPCRPNRASDGDVMLHEYGHAIQNDQVPGWGIPNPMTGREETRAMGEGFGDILACVYFAEHGNGFQREVFEDWIFGDRGGLRRTDGTKQYPSDWHNEEHDDGEIWSAALWSIFLRIGGNSDSQSDRLASRDALLKTLILSHHSLPPDASMPDGAEALMETNAELPEFRGKHLIEMLKSFHERGILHSGPGVDLFLRKDSSDTGLVPFAGPVINNSPDIWIRNLDDNGSVHQQPKAGQDNWFYARVHNRGTSDARAFVVTFNVELASKDPFTYPADFTPFVSAAVGFNLSSGATTVVKARWPSSIVPAPGAIISCLASVHQAEDLPLPGTYVPEHNNLAQLDMTTAHSQEVSA